MDESIRERAATAMRQINQGRANGRNLWVFEQQDGAWIALWRAMLEMKEEAA